MYVLDFVIPLNREELREATSAGQFSVSETYSVNEIRERIEAAKTALSEEGTDFIVDHFATFYSLFEKFSQSSVVVRQKGWVTITKAFNSLSTNLNALFEDTSNIDSEIQSKMCNITKMITYTMVELMKLYQDKYTDQSNAAIDGKGKKKQIKPVEDGWDWNEEKHQVLVAIYNLLQMPLKLLWEPPVVDEEFVNLVANICYKFLEDTTINAGNLKYLRETIFQILGLLIKNYLHGLSFCVKVVQLLRMQEHLVNPLAQGIVQLVKECNCNQVVKEIVREIADTDGDQLVADTVGTRSLNLFLVQLAESIPGMIIPAIDLLIHHLSGDSYTMRICVLGVLGEIVQTTLTKENLDENLKKMRDDFLDSLTDHIHDSNAHVRTKVLQAWQKLCLAKAIPLTRLNHLLELTVGRLNDKSTNVKKQAVHLIKDLLEGNPYSGQLNTGEIKTQLEEEIEKLKKIKKANNLENSEFENDLKKIEESIKKLLEESEDEESESESEDEESCVIEEAINQVGDHLTKGQFKKALDIMKRLKKEFAAAFNMENDNFTEETLIPLLKKIYERKVLPQVTDLSPEVLEKIEKHEKTIDYLENALQFAKLIDRVLPIILTFLDSSTVTDVLEAVHFFTAAYLFGFNQALEGIRKMMYLVFSKEANIKSAVSAAYRDLYFNTNLTGRQHSVMAVKNLSDLVLKLNPSQLDALEQVVREWVKEDVIDKSFIQVLFERFSLKIPGTTEKQSWAALVLIRMVGAEESKVIKDNVPVLINQGLGNRGYKNFLLAKETCRAFHRLLPAKQPGKPVDQTLRYARDHEILTELYRLLRDGMWRTNDPFYIPMVDDAINLVFTLCEHPDAFSEQLITELHDRILKGKKPERKTRPKTGKTLMTNTELNGDLCENGEENPEEIEENVENEPENPSEVTLSLLTRFISILGQVAANYILYLEGPVLDELKRRNQLDYERKLKKFQDTKKGNSSMRRGKKDESALEDTRNEKLNQETGAEDLEFNRVAADDMDADEMKKRTEKEIVTGKGFLAKFAPLILTICKNPGKFNNAPLQNAALLTLAKFMQVSSSFCEENLQLLVTICEKSQCPDRRQNAIIALGALQYRFPNSLEPWTPHMYAMLKDENPSVRMNSIMVLTDLIVNEMIKVRSHISDLAICIVDDEIKIAQTSRHFFREYSQKGNSLYNVLPSLISNLTQPNTTLSEDEFKTVMKFILGLITKDKQSEYLVEKLCQYFESATSERQWKDLAYCLSLLNYTDKGLKKLLENLRYFANKLYLGDVYEAFSIILTTAGKNPQKDKNILKELQDAIKECRDKVCEDKNIPINFVQKKCPPSTRKRIVRRKLMGSEEEDDEEDEKEPKVTRRSTRVRKENLDLDDDDDDDDAFMSDSSRKSALAKSTKKKKHVQKEVDISEENDSDENPKKIVKRTKNKTTTKKSKPKYSDDTSEEEAKPKKQLRNTRKRK